jgi:methylated-DNA-[protein]-cysteine S-methyltransferase
MKDSVIHSPIGKLTLHVSGDRLTKIEFASPDTKLKTPEHPVAQKTAQQIQTYFSNPNFTFDLPHLLQGTPFQIALWQHLATIPVGSTQTYGEIAKALNSSPRAIGNACRKNPLPIIFPCHRVVAQHHIGGFAGEVEGRLINIKQKLLEHERN